MSRGGGNRQLNSAIHRISVTSQERGLIFGYAVSSEGAIRRGIELLAAEVGGPT